MMRSILGLVAVLALAGCSSGATTTTPVPVQATPPPVTISTPEPLPADPDAGRIIFGKGIKPDTLAVIKPGSSFGRKTKSIAWVAHLAEPAGTSSLTLQAFRVKGSAEELIDSVSWTVSPDWSLTGNEGDLAGAAGNKAGTYRLVLSREGDVLAEGTFKLTK